MIRTNGWIHELQRWKQAPFESDEKCPYAPVSCIIGPLFVRNWLRLPICPCFLHRKIVWCRDGRLKAFRDEDDRVVYDATSDDGADLGHVA